MDSLTITSDSLRLASDSLNFFMKVLPEIKMQLCILKPLIICLSFMLLIDFLTGVRKAKALGEKIQSRGFRRTISKMNVCDAINECSQGTQLHLLFYICTVLEKVNWKNNQKQGQVTRN